jgi:proteasome component ECM29
MATPPAPPSEARELSLLDKVELKIALSNSDDSLQKSLSTYLAPVLLKLASDHLSVRNKVISICQHINTRLTPQYVLHICLYYQLTLT